MVSAESKLLAEGGEAEVEGVSRFELGLEQVEDR